MQFAWSLSPLLHPLGLIFFSLKDGQKETRNEIEEEVSFVFRGRNRRQRIRGRNRSSANSLREGD